MRDVSHKRERCEREESSVTFIQVALFDEKQDMNIKVTKSCILKEHVEVGGGEIYISETESELENLCERFG